MAVRTFKIDDPLMQGGDIENWQNEIVQLFGELKIDNVPLEVDGVYGHITRSLTATLCEAKGMIPEKVMAKGTTPNLLRRLRKHDLTEAEKKRYVSSKCKRFRAKLRKQWATKKVHSPVTKIITDSWGYHPGVHDGVDVICPASATLYAMVKARVFDVRAGGWWGQAPSGNVAAGDGIIQLEVLESVGPFKKGMHIGYGHAEKAIVREGQIVEAGQPIGAAGLAVAWHIHLMVNGGNTTSGRGDRDPRPLLDYAVKHG
jgi:murein DD-endopeptidase MepM/ murein hydrolase activator NlpD